MLIFTCDFFCFLSGRDSYYRSRIDQIMIASLKNLIEQTSRFLNSITIMVKLLQTTNVILFKRIEMMKKIIFRIPIVCLYCFPFVYFSMYIDFAHGSMFGYLIMVLGTLILAFFGKLLSNTRLVIIGNIASVIVSFYFLHQMEMTLGVGWDGGYYKPLTPYQLLLFVSFLNLIPQFLMMKLANRVKKK